MPTTTIQACLKIRAIAAAADTNCTAVASAELPAAFVSFQRQQPSFPPSQNVISAVSPLPAASHFGGKYAINAKFMNQLQHLQH